MMAYIIKERSRAVEEVQQAYHWYLSQSEKAASDFLTALDNFYDSLEINPEVYSYSEKPLRKGRLAKFPYIVIFEIQEDIVVIFSVFHGSQDPLKKPTDTNS